jgi:hypothetical protein
MIGCSPAIRRGSVKTNFELIDAVADAGPGLVDLWEASPVRLDSNGPRADEIVSALFSGNPLLCCGWTRHRFDTRPRNRWYKLNGLQFIVPNPMTARCGCTRSQKISAHTRSNTGARRFVIIEFDFEADRSGKEMRLFTKLEKQRRDVRDLSAALLLHLAEKAPLAAAVYSGHKSLHGWFYCAGVADKKMRRFFEYALSLGADEAHWNPSQFARMPDGLRDGVARQRVYFFNPAVLQ